MTLCEKLDLSFHVLISDATIAGLEFSFSSMTLIGNLKEREITSFRRVIPSYLFQRYMGVDLLNYHPSLVSTKWDSRFNFDLNIPRGGDCKVGI